MHRHPQFRTRAARATVLTTSAALLISGCASPSATDATDTVAAPQEDGVLKIGVLNDIGQVPDPDIYYSGNGLAITTNVYEGLVQYEPGNETEAVIAPLLAESWESNDDFTEWTFALREGVTFHDGTKFDATAVGASFERRSNVNAGPAYMVSGVSEVRIVDDHTVTVVLNEPNSAFLDYLASPYGPRMMSPTILKEQAGDDFAKSYLATADAGTGPYVLSSAVVGEGYELSYFDDYWQDLDPAFTTIDLDVYSAMSAMQLELESGDLDILFNPPTSSKQKYLDSDAVAGYALPSFQVGVSYFNPNRELLATPEARVALFNGIDWASLVAQVTPVSSVVSEGYYPTGSLPVDLDQRELEFDPDGLASWIQTLPSGTSIQIGTGAGSEDGTQMANIIAAQLQAAGLPATVTEHQSSEVFSTFYEDPASSPDMYIATNTWPDSNSPYMHGHVFWDADGGLNHLQCSDPETSELLAEALKTGEAEKYLAAAQAQQKAMCAPVFARGSDFVVAQTWIAGVEEAHSIAEPLTLDFAFLSIDK
ncbi:ABC transporter substrate-binding protein [Microbacterium nanhaiense]|uniref:ABC transporter substrate-binding protein n=1 Tax=Microbacterium nanhaiense TaxID=1301026 RepID=UPI001668C88E|nr:ABC transporter substrate-binding protein [Microbacterium nanhaiense]